VVDPGRINDSAVIAAATQPCMTPDVHVNVWDLRLLGRLEERFVGPQGATPIGEACGPICNLSFCIRQDIVGTSPHLLI